MIQIYEDDTEMIVNHDPHPNHHQAHDYPFHWRGNYTVNYDNETYLSDTSVIFMGLFCACFMVKVLSFCADYYSRVRGGIPAQRVAQGNGQSAQTNEQNARIARQIKINSKTRVITDEGLHGDLLNECSICLENFDVGQKVSELSCNHLFHKECVEQWMQNNHNCPLCRLSV